MKNKIWILLVSLCLCFWYVSAQSIDFQVQWNWEFWYGCLVPVDVYVDTQWQEISAMDLIIETSMEYKDFQKTNALPYFFPPMIKWNWLIHIIWFSVEKNERFNWKEKIWTIYFTQKDKSIDWALKVLFLWEWETIDSNLSVAWWIDVLRQVGDAYVKFSADLPACEQQIIDEKLGQIDWYSNKDFDESLQEIMNQIELDHPSAENKINDEWWIMKNWWMYFCVWLGVILLIVVICVIYKILSNKKKNSQWNN